MMKASKKPINILITHVYSNDNKGDAAILSVMINDAKSVFPKSNIAILTFDKVCRNEKFEGVPVYRSFMGIALDGNYFKPFKLLYSAYVMLVTILAAVLSRVNLRLTLGSRLVKAFRLYLEADIAIGVGGGYLRGRPGLVSTVELMLQLHPILLSRVLGQRVVLYSQSIGPFGNKFQEELARLVLRRVDLIIAREDATKNLLKRLGISDNVVRSVDSGFSFDGNKKMDLHKELNIPTGRRIVGVTVRKWLLGSDQEKYEHSVAEVADFLISSGYAVVFVPQVTSTTHHDDDRVASRDVFSLMRSKNMVYVLDKQYDHHQIKSVYSDLDFLLGTRFHSVIFSLTSLVPAVAIEYEHKTSGIMHDLKLDKWVIKIEDVTAKNLKDLLSKLLKEEKKYKEALRATLPRYLDKGNDTRKLLKGVAR
jgi:colanic acid/amylovoran biosynthesis protein